MAVKSEFQWRAIPDLQFQEERDVEVVVEDVIGQGRDLVRVAVTVKMDAALEAVAILLRKNAPLMANGPLRVVVHAAVNVRLMMVAATAKASPEAVQTRADQTKRKRNNLTQ